MSKSKQGKYADRGLIIENVLKQASREILDEPKDGHKKKIQHDLAPVDSKLIKQESSDIMAFHDRNF